jgi:rhodanese-related sulfurtransferase
MMSVSALGTITPRELSTLLTNDDLVVLDVREPYEWSYARIPGARLMPLGTIPDAAASLDRDADIIVYCHHGARSADAGHTLLAAGFRRVRNLVGGIDRWSREVDPAVPRY